MSPGARIAVYKVCWKEKEGYCDNSDILSAIDRALKDAVNVLSISIAGKNPSSYHHDSYVWCNEMGILVSCVAGNYGPDAGTIANVSPWMITVRTSSIDRDFPSIVTPGNGKIVTGVSSYREQRSHRVEKGEVVKITGGIGMILVNTAENDEDLISEYHIISTVAVGEVVEGSEIPEAMFHLLEEFSDVFPDELPDALPHLCDIQHH
nr:hypothetical protein [Tanacetum cinerariifolium]